MRENPGRALLVEHERYVAQGALATAIERRAQVLLERCGGTDHVVAVQLAPGIDSVVSYFACLAAGLRHLPLPAHKAVAARLARSLEPRLLVTSGAAPWAADIDIATLRVDDEASSPRAAMPLPAPEPTRIAHVLPTSGTETGAPKAVLTDHVGSMLSYAWRSRLWPYSPGRDAVGCNIFGIWDVVPALCNGAPAVMIDDTTIRDPYALAATIVRDGVTRLMLTPTLLDACLSCEDAVDALRRLERIVLCGEPVRPALAARAWEALPEVAIANLYSLAECHDVAGGDLAPGARVGAGRVADFAEVHITDTEDRARLLPAGEAGRILIGGAALAAGYADPELTARRFFSTSFARGEQPQRVYDSGDLGILHEDGTLEVVGRIDRAVKVRGAWAEPESIAALLAAHPHVARAALLADGGGRGRLTAFIVARGGEPARDFEATLRRWLEAQVAPQSVPAQFTIVDELPLLPSGKIDAGALRAHAPPARHASARAQFAPGRSCDPLQSAVLASLRETLQRPEAGLDDDLATLGADSLARVVLCAELERRTSRRLRLDDLRRCPTARALAADLASRDADRRRHRWELPPLGLDFDGASRRPSGGTLHRVFVTGATGTLGAALIAHLLRATDLGITALVRAADAAHARARLAARLGAAFDERRVETVVGDLALPRFGMAADAFRQLAVAVDAVVHAGADLDMFAAYEALEAVNVRGTHEVLRLAGEGGARVHHVSSSAVLPLDSEHPWDESHGGHDFLVSLVAALARSDGYSRSKLAAEALVWRAAEQGVAASVTRLPHLLVRGVQTRLTATLRAFAECGAIAQPRWSWQLAPVELACAHFAAQLAASTPPVLVHLAPPPLDAAAIVRALRSKGIGVAELAVPALVAHLAGFERSAGRSRRDVVGLNQLIREHGPRAALGLADAKLVSRAPPQVDEAALLDDLVASLER